MSAIAKASEQNDYVSKDYCYTFGDKKFLFSCMGMYVLCLSPSLSFLQLGTALLTATLSHVQTPVRTRALGGPPRAVGVPVWRRVCATPATSSVLEGV